MNENNHLKKQITKARDMRLFESKLDNVQNRKTNVNEKLRKRINEINDNTNKLSKDINEYIVRNGYVELFNK